MHKTRFIVKIYASPAFIGSLDGFIVISHRRWSIRRWPSNVPMPARASSALIGPLDGFIAKKVQLSENHSL